MSTPTPVSPVRATRERTREIAARSVPLSRLAMHALAGAVLLLLAGAAPLASPPRAPHGAHRESPASAPRAATTAIGAALDAVPLRTTTGRSEALSAGVHRFYAARSDVPVWLSPGGWTPAGARLLRVLAAAEAEGLRAADYVVAPPSAAADSFARAEADVRLSAAALSFAHDLGWGMVAPGEVTAANHYARRAFDADRVLETLAAAPDAGEALRAFAPRSPTYASLRAALAELRTRAARGGWSTVEGGPALRPGARGPRVAGLRALLVERGDLAPSAAGVEQFDATLAEAVLRFQRRHGLDPDTVFGPSMVRELNVPLAARMTQVRLGMERARWLPPDPVGRWITVNLADFRVVLYEDGRRVFETRAVIGKRYHETPLFADTMQYLVINPYWNVPPGIVANEIAPKLRRDPGYLARNHMERYDGGIRQRPGPGNALGAFKFIFPNDHAIYLHDTPSRALFERTERAFSHGCIRLQDPAGLAAALLAPQGWTPEEIARVRARGARAMVTLERPVPVRITYATAFLGPDGTLQYRRDVYDRDARLARALEARRARED